MTILAQYKVDEGVGETNLIDSSGNGNDATLVATNLGVFWGNADLVAQSIQDAENAADELYFMDADGIAIPKTQAEFLSDGIINYDKQRYLTKCAGKNVELWYYKTPRTETEDFEILVASCNAVGLGVDGEQIFVAGVPVGVRI